MNCPACNSADMATTVTDGHEHLVCICGCTVCLYYSEAMIPRRVM